MYDRLAEWDKFAEQVRRHIILYTLKQYGNPEGNEQVDGFSVEDCWTNAQRYYNRRNARVRGNKELMRDPIKVAHYMSFIYSKLRNELGEPDVYSQSDQPHQTVFEPGLG